MPLGNFFGSLIGTYADETLQKQKAAREAEDSQKLGEVNGLKMVLADPRATPEMQKAAYDRIIELSGAPKKTAMNLKGIFQRMTGGTGNVPQKTQSLDTTLSNSMASSGTPPSKTSVTLGAPSSPGGMKFDTQTAKPFYSPEEMQQQELGGYQKKVDIDTTKALAVEQQKDEDKRAQEVTAQTNKERLEHIRQQGRESLADLRSSVTFKKLDMQMKSARSRQGASQGGSFSRQQLAFQHQDQQATMKYGQQAVQDTLTLLQKQQTEIASIIKDSQKKNGMLGMEDDNIAAAQNDSENIVKAMAVATKLGPALRNGQITGEQYLNAVNQVRHGFPEPPVTSDQPAATPGQAPRTPAPAKIGNTPVIDLRSP